MNKKSPLFSGCTLIVAIAFAVSLTACGGRSASPVSAREAGDKKLSCEEIEIERFAVEEEAQALFGEGDDKTSSNIGWGVAGLIFPPLWLGLDLSSAEKQEARALQARSRHLQKLAYKKDC